MKTDGFIEEVIQGDCTEILDNIPRKVALTFLDPPFNQGKEYRFFDDNMEAEKYWSWMKTIVEKIYRATIDGGAIYFMQREKNVGWVLRVLQETGWTIQNIIVWKKLTSAVPQAFRYNKAYQIIVFATKGDRPRVFNKVRIDYPMMPWHKQPRRNGVQLTDVWDDIRELTSGYFAGDEPLRRENGERLHLQQSPVALLLRILLVSSLPGDLVLDPFAGSGTTLVVAKQLKRQYIGIEIDPEYVEVIMKRLATLRPADNIERYRSYYRFTESLDSIWPRDTADILRYT